jgi:hypothetical protein
MADITSPKRLNTRRERSYPRVVKRARHNSHRVKKPGQHGTRHDAPATIKLVNPVLTRAKQQPQRYLNKLSGIGCRPEAHHGQCG